jgi:hypothetical protein
MVYSLKYVNTYNAYIRKIEPKYIGTEYLLSYRIIREYLYEFRDSYNYNEYFYFTLYFE